MSAFWFLAGMLTMLAALIVILPWLRTIPRFEALPALPWHAPLLGLFVVGAAVGLYHWLGSPQSIEQSPGATPAVSASAGSSATPGPPAGGGGTASAGSMNAAVESLRTRLAAGGGSPDDWELLAKSYDFMGEPDAARQARDHQMPAKTVVPASTAMTPVALSPESVKLLSRAAQAHHDRQYAAAAALYKQLAAAKQMNADAWADYADTAATIQGDKLTGEPEAYADNALSLDPQHPKALWLKASAEEETGRYAAAVATWQQLSAVLPPESQDAKIVGANLQRDRDAAGRAGEAAPRARGASISGEVSLNARLTAQTAPGATLFIVVKSVEAPGPPVAIFRGSVGTWPVKFTLDDSSSMIPGRNLTNSRHVTVEARISRSGQAQPAAGDLRGVTGVIDPSSHELLKIVINEVIT